MQHILYSIIYSVFSVSHRLYCYKLYLYGRHRRRQRRPVIGKAPQRDESASDMDVGIGWRVSHEPTGFDVCRHPGLAAL